MHGTEYSDSFSLVVSDLPNPQWARLLLSLQSVWGAWDAAVCVGMPLAWMPNRPRCDISARTCWRLFRIPPHGFRTSCRTCAFAARYHIHSRLSHIHFSNHKIIVCIRCWRPAFRIPPYVFSLLSSELLGSVCIRCLVPHHFRWPPQPHPFLLIQDCLCPRNRTCSWRHHCYGVVMHHHNSASHPSCAGCS